MTDDNGLKDYQNDEFKKLVSQLRNLGQTQEQIAKTLGVSPSHVSGIISGKKQVTREHDRALQVRLRQLSRERSDDLADASKTPRLRSPFQMDEFSLRRLSATEAIEAFRLLCWARAHERCLPTTSVNISMRAFAADGGIDASVSSKNNGNVDGDDLLGVSTGFQIKTGDFSPWKRSVIHKELFSSSSNKADREKLGSEVLSLLEKKQRYVMVCFGKDLLSRERGGAVNLIKEAFAKCGFKDVDVDVWGQGELLGLFSQYPSLCLRIRGHEVKGIRSREAWATNEDMKQSLHHGPELQQLKDKLLRQLRSGDVRHIRLLGEPGIGKTRFALDLTGDDDLAPVTIYVQGGEAMLGNSLLNELIQPDDRRVALFVVDECPQRDVASIWNAIKTKSDRIKLISIHHGEDATRDDQTLCVELPRTDKKEIGEILMDYNIGQNEARRWAEFCEGSPRVAHVVGANLSCKSNDILTSPTASNVWERFLDGYTANQTDQHETQKIVLRYVAIFERFGFESEVESEARFIQEMIQHDNPNITWAKFCEAIEFWRSRKVIQGTTTLYITPRLLHVFLYKDFWKRYGHGFNIAEEMRHMPDALQVWFSEMIKHSHDSKYAISSIEELLGPRGPYVSAFPVKDGECRLLVSLSESCPSQVVSYLKRTLGKMDVNAIKSLLHVRHYIVWAIENLAVWDEYFSCAARLLLKIAAVDDSSHSNHAAETFTGLFSLTPGFAATAASPAKRVSVLEESLKSISPNESDIALAACAEALSVSPKSRIVRPEYQGHRPTMQFWRPVTYKELWDSYFEIWTLLNQYLSLCPKEQRRRVISTIVQGSHWMTPLPRFASKIAPRLKALSVEEGADVSEIIEFLQFYSKHNGKKLPKSVAADFRKLVKQFDGDDFASTSKRFLRDLTREDCYDEDGKKLLDKKLEWLASVAIENPNLLSNELPWLVSETSSATFWFGRRMSQADTYGEILPVILSEYRHQNCLHSTMLLCGYLSAIGGKDMQEWEAIVLDLAKDQLFASHFSHIVIQSGMTDAAVLKTIELCESGLLPVEKLKNWCYADAIKAISEPVFHQLIELQLFSRTEEMWENSLQMCNNYYSNERSLPESLIFRVLCEQKTMSSKIADSAGYCWTELANRFIASYPHRKWDVFKAGLMQESSLLGCIEYHKEGFMTQLTADSPSRAWSCIKEVLEELKDRKWAIASWLSGCMTSTFGHTAFGPIQYISPSELFSWVELDRESRAYWLCQALPQTLNESPSGRLARNFLARFGNDESTYRSFTTRFMNRSWSGNESEHCRELRDEARNWLKGETNKIVVTWIEEYIEALGYDIQRAEIEEERGI